MIGRSSVSAVLLPLLGFVRTQQAAGHSAWLRGRLGQHVTDSMQGMAEITGYGHTGRRLDEMTALTQLATNFPKNRVLGQAGMLDTARFTNFVARELSVPVGSVQEIL